MKQERIERLKELTSIKKRRDFSIEEHAEYEDLKADYVASVKENLHKQLENAGIKRRTDNNV